MTTENQPKKIPNQKMTRTVDLNINEVRSENDTEKEKILEGYAVVFDSPTVLYEYDGIEYKEVIAKGAFDNANFKDCCLKYNHGDNALILARTRGGSLQISIDEHGLKFRAKLPNTSSANDVYELVKERLLDKCSFAFRCEEDSYNIETHTRTILKIKRVYDLSVVDIPAYDDTNVEARSYFDGIAKKHSLDKERRRKRLICRTYL